MPDLERKPLELNESEALALELCEMGAIVFYDYRSSVAVGLEERGLVTTDPGLNPPFVALFINDNGRQALAIHRALESDVRGS